MSEEEFYNKLNKVTKRYDTLNERFNYYLSLSIREDGSYLEIIKKKLEEIDWQLNRVARKRRRLINSYYGGSIV